jgi:hypothetical protein
LIEPVVYAPTWLSLPLLLACSWLEAGAIVFGSLLTLLFGEGFGRTEPPKMSR